MEPLYIKAPYARTDQVKISALSRGGEGAVRVYRSSPDSLALQIREANKTSDKLHRYAHVTLDLREIRQLRDYLDAYIAEETA